METWTTELIGPQLEKTVLITGGTEGVGLEVARELCRNGADVIICAEDVTKGEKALFEIRSSVDRAKISYEHVDLADLDSVKVFANKFVTEHDRLHVLINNAEISHLHERIHSAQGHELMFAKNYLAPFVLTARLFPLLERTRNARVIFQTSPEHEKGVIDFFDLDATHYYESKKAFAQSKLALLIFAKELDRRLRETSLDVRSMAVQATSGSILSKLLPFNSTNEQAAWSTLYAATAKDVKSGNFYGPGGASVRRASPVELDTPINAKNIFAAEKLWEISEELGGVEFGLRNMSNILPFQMRGNIEPELFT